MRRLEMVFAAIVTALAAFEPGDILLFGRESAGVPDSVRDRADAALLIPMRGGGRLSRLCRG